MIAMYKSVLYILLLLMYTRIMFRIDKKITKFTKIGNFVVIHDSQSPEETWYIEENIQLC